MKYAVWMAALFLPALCFSQMLERKTDLSGNIGMQISEFQASGKGARAGEAYYFNTLLYYRTRYLIGDDEILGTVSGRITKEEPLSSLSFVQLEAFRNPQASYSNLLNAYPQYYNALSNYDLFIRLFEESLRQAAEAAETTSQDGDYGDYDDYPDPYEADEEELVVLRQSPQRAVFQNADTNFAVPVPMAPFPPLEEVLKDSTKSLSAKELEFLIRYEELTRAYSNTVVEYQKVLAARKLLDDRPFFDPADPNERFRLVVAGGDDAGLIWIKDFSLDGEKNYQSYDKDLWFLRYELPLTKKDIRLLSNIYLKSKTVSFQVMGKGGMVQIPLSGAQTAAFKKLFEDYVFGKMVLPEQNPGEFPLLR